MSERASERDNYLTQPDDYIELGNRQSQVGNALGALAAYDFPKGTLRDRSVSLAPSYADAYNYRGSFKFAHLGDIQGATAEDGARASPISIALWLSIRSYPKLITIGARAITKN
jgi:hypothetical protein